MEAMGSRVENPEIANTNVIQCMKQFMAGGSHRHEQSLICIRYIKHDTDGGNSWIYLIRLNMIERKKSNQRGKARLPNIYKSLKRDHRSRNQPIHVFII